MKKKLIGMLLTGVMAVSMLAGCGSSGNSGNNGMNTDVSAGVTANEGDSVGAANDADAASDAEEFDASEFISVTSREEGSGTRGAFVELFEIEQKDSSGNKVDYTTVEANITNSTDVMMTTVAGNEYAIGYVSLGSLNDTVKAVSIDGAEATVENINNGSYAISRPFNIATKGEVSAAAEDFINFILSADGQQVINDNKYITVSDAAGFTGNGAEGKVVVAGSSSVTPVMEKLKEAYAQVNGAVEIEIQESDSTTGMTAAIDGTCDIGMASRELKDSEIESGLSGTTIALDGIAVIINKANPITELKKEDVKNIFCGDVATWEEVMK